MPTHQEIDARCLSMHGLIAEKIRSNPALFDRVKVTLAAWRRIVCAQSQPYLQEWESLVNQGCEACLVVATEDSEHATALRQASHFTACSEAAEAGTLKRMMIGAGVVGVGAMMYQSAKHTAKHKN